MNGFLNRELQKEILVELRNSYPDIPRRNLTFEDLKNRPSFLQNAHYLYEHELLKMELSRDIGGDTRVKSIRITARGLDFLEDDGGLSAILGVVTVKFEAKTLKALIENNILKTADLPEEKKGLFRKALAVASEATLQEIMAELVRVGTSKWPEMLTSLIRILGVSLP